MKTVIIGAGIGGLATAALLAKDGHDVTVLEKNEALGGRASFKKTKGFFFDLGPSWYLMPEVFEKFFQEFGYTTKDLLNLVPLDPQYRIFFPDNTTVDITKDIAKTHALFESIEPGSAAQLDRYLADSQTKYDISMKSFLYRNSDSILYFLSKDSILNGPKLGVFESMDTYVQKYFKSEKLQQIIQYTLVFLGGSPKKTPALYSLMSHIDFNLGVWYPQGGVYELIKAMKKLGSEHGVKYELNSAVTKIITKDGKTTGVRVGKKLYAADLVVSNADYTHTESLIDDPSQKGYSDEYWDSRTLAPSAFLLYLGVKGKIPKLAHHNLYFGEDWTKHFESIFDAPSWPETPSLYINKPSATDPSVAPKGHEALMVLVPIASKLEDSPEQREKYAEFILDYIEKNLDIKLKKNIIYKEIFSLTEFINRYNSFGGSALGLAHTLKQTAVFRPRNRSQKLGNLYFVGGSTVPGIGMPICLISAHLIRDRVQKEQS